jgi:hypothetical protein
MLVKVHTLTSLGLALNMPLMGLVERARRAFAAVCCHFGNFGGSENIEI